MRGGCTKTRTPIEPDRRTLSRTVDGATKGFAMPYRAIMSGRFDIGVGGVDRKDKVSLTILN